MTARDDGARAAAPMTDAAPRTGATGAGTRLLDSVRRSLAEAGAEPTPAGVAAALRAQGRLMGDSAVLGVVEALRSELVGVGPLEPLLADPEATDVLVTAPDQVWVDRGRGLEPTRVRFPDAAAVRRLAQRLATSAGRRLDDARPWVDARLPDGTRLHAVLPPVAVGCTCLSLRVMRPRAFGLAELVTAGTVPPGGERLLRAVLDARLSFVVSGGTGAARRHSCPPCWGWSARTNASSSPRTRPNCAPTTPMSYGWRHARPTRRAWAGWNCAIWCGRRCACGPTAWSWARSGGPRSPICWPR